MSTGESHVLEQTNKRYHRKCNVNQEKHFIRLDAEPHHREPQEQTHCNSGLSRVSTIIPGRDRWELAYHASHIPVLFFP